MASETVRLPSLEKVIASALNRLLGDTAEALIDLCYRSELLRVQLEANAWRTDDGNWVRVTCPDCEYRKQGFSPPSLWSPEFLHAPNCELAAWVETLAALRRARPGWFVRPETFATCRHFTLDEDMLCLPFEKCMAPDREAGTCKPKSHGYLTIRYRCHRCGATRARNMNGKDAPPPDDDPDDRFFAEYVEDSPWAPAADAPKSATTNISPEYSKA
ncbi:MAG: hypothetical protein NUW22_13740 [Acidobacteria bacterium]|nr:hypothetical protein [Acidobacteriota bacterium]